MEHILLCGRRRSGKSAMIRRLLENVRGPVFGYETITMGTRPDGYHEIYLYPYGVEHPERQESNHVADCNTRDRVIHTEVFDTLGVACIRARKAGILVMDEIGFMESEAEAFCHAILEKLDGDLPITEFLELEGLSEDAFDADSDTLGGWVIESLGGHFPEAGETFVHENLRITVLSMDGRRVDRVLVKRIRNEESESRK